MAELPEIKVLAGQISNELSSKKIEYADVRQEKCLNMPVEEFKKTIADKKIIGAYNKGKWIFICLSDGYNLLLNVGMGGDILYYPPKSEWSSEYQIRFHFSNSSGFTCKFWWFGHVHLLNEKDEHKETASIGISPLDDGFTKEYFYKLLGKNRAGIKSFILNQKNIGGIGNMYIHDILFKAGIHPLKKADSLTNEQKDKLYYSITESMRKAYESNGFSYEKDFYGKNGGVTMDWFLVGYKEYQPCPVCANKIEKIKTGGTSSFICANCQKT